MSHIWDEEDDDDSGKGGKSGDVNFRFKTEIYRDEQLSPRELNHLQQVHHDLHKAFVDKQKLLRKEREQIKDQRQGQKHQHRVGYGPGSGRGGGAGSGKTKFKEHPLAAKAQFSGSDPQVSQLPNENEADTNAELRNKLENRHNYNFQPTRQFNPKPSPF